MPKKNKKTVSKNSKNEIQKLQKKVIFCKGTEYEVLTDEKEQVNYREKIEQLKLGNYRELELDYKGEHNGVKIYTIKLNKRDRVVFHYQKDEKKEICFLVVRELLLKHNYRDSKILRNLEGKLTPEELATLSLKTPEERLEEELANVEISVDVEVSEGKELWFDGKIIVLSEKQKEAEKSSTSMPFLIEGPPGSGKSIILLLGVYHRLQQLTPDDDDILVCAESEILVADLKRLWKENFSGVSTEKVQFKTYKQLILERMESRPAEKEEPNYFTGYEQFKAFYKEFRKSAPTKIIAKKSVKVDEAYYVIPADSGKITTDELEELLCRGVYQELRVIAFWKRYDPRIGQKDSYFDITTENDEQHPSEIKDWITWVYEIYPNKNRDLSFMSIPPHKRKKTFSAAFGDEIQDYSSEQGGLVSCLCGGQLGGYFDSLQSVKADRPIINVLKSVLNAQGFECDDSLILPDTYRCPQVIAAIAEPIIQMRNTLAGGTGKKRQLTQFCVAETEWNKNGNAHLYLLKTEQERITLINEIRGHLGCYKPTEILIITHEDKEVTKSIFGENCAVMTPEEAKGLEFDLVILWYPMGKPSSPLYNNYKNANTKLRVLREKNGSSSSSYQHQATLENMDNRFSRLFQELFTALTRTKKRVICCLDECSRQDREQSEIVKRLLAAFPEPEALPQSSGVLESTDSEWHERIYQLLLNNKITDAKERIERNLHREEMDVNKRLHLYFAYYYQNKGVYNDIYAGLPVESRLFIKTILGEEKSVKQNIIGTEVNNDTPLCFQWNEKGERHIDAWLKEENLHLKAFSELWNTFQNFRSLEDSKKRLNMFFNELLSKLVNGKFIVSLFHSLARYALCNETESDISQPIAESTVALLTELSKNAVFIKKLKSTLEQSNALCGTPADPIMPSLLYCLVSTPIGYQIFSEYLNTPAIRKKITGKVLFKRYDNKNETPFIGTSVFYYLVLRDETDTIVRDLFESGNMVDGTLITPTYQAKEGENVYYYVNQFENAPQQQDIAKSAMTPYISVPISPIYTLLKKGIENPSYWLMEFLKKLSAFKNKFNAMTEGLLNETLPEQENLAYYSGRPFLYYWLKIFHDVLDDSEDALNNVQEKTSMNAFSCCLSKMNDIENINEIEIILHCFDLIHKDIKASKEREGEPTSYKEIIEKLFSLDEIKKLTDEEFMSAFVDDLFGGKENKAGFYFVEMLYKIISDANEPIAKDLVEIIFQQLSDANMSDEALAILLRGLCSQEPGGYFLADLIKIKPDFVSLINKKCLFSEHASDFFKGNLLRFLLDSTLAPVGVLWSYFIENSNSWKILADILRDENVERHDKRLLIRKLLTRYEIKIFDNLSKKNEVTQYEAPFYRLVNLEDENALSFLEAIVESAKHLNEIKTDEDNFIPVLFSKVLFDKYLIGNSESNELIIFTLSKTPEKRKILLAIVEMLSDYENNLVSDAKYAVYLLAKMRTGDCAGRSVVHNLVKTEDGIQILLKFFSVRTGSMIYSPLFPIGLCEISSFLDNKTPLEYLCRSLDARVFKLLTAIHSNASNQVSFQNKITEILPLYICVIESSPEKKTLGNFFVPKNLVDATIVSLKILEHYSEDLQNDFVLKIKNNLNERSIVVDENASTFTLVKAMLQGLSVQDYDNLREEINELYNNVKNSYEQSGIVASIASSETDSCGFWSECYITAVSDILLGAVSQGKTPIISENNINENDDKNNIKLKSRSHSPSFLTWDNVFSSTGEKSPTTNDVFQNANTEVKQQLAKKS